ncbi:MAG: DUF951 domain-containing protein [Anaerolineae bacterium]|nr:DUF951 domain-containing protein [Anaerolineae bacterium]
MTSRAPLSLNVGDVVELRKGHPCGGNTWRILRVGVDIGMECMTCQRYVLVPRSRFEARVKRFVERASGAPEIE